MNEPFPVVELPEYSAKLFARRHTAVAVPQAAAKLGAWKPLPNDCHGNVSTWCANMPDHSPVHGWLYFDFVDELPFVLFNAHSVVRDPERRLWDITPSQASHLYPFLVAEESNEEYAALIQRGVSRLRHVK